MSYTEAVARVAQIQSEVAALRTGSTQATPATNGFAATLAAAQAQGSAAPLGQTASISAFGAAQPGGMEAQLSTAAQGMLTPGQRQFASRLAGDTGLNPQVVAAWLLAEESGSAAQSREAAGNNDWLNIGYTDSGTYGSADSVWSSPTSAAEATAGWLKGQPTIPGYGAASSGIQSILATAGQSPEAQVAAIQQSGWASSGYPDLPALYGQVAG